MKSTCKILVLLGLAIPLFSCESPEAFPGVTEPRACNFETLVGYGYMEQCANGDKLCFLYDGTFADTNCIYKDSRSVETWYCAESCK
jgi:hypothetical protein